MKKYVLLLLVLSMCQGLAAQKIFTRHQGWTDLTLWYKLGENTKVGGDFGYRTSMGDYKFHQMYYRPTIKWSNNSLYNLCFAISNFQTFNTESSNLNELRFAQEAMLFWPNTKILKFNHRLRFEERFFYINENKENQTRMRYRLSLAPPNFTLFGKENFYAELTWETFVTLTNSIQYSLGSQHRWEAVLGNKITKRFKIGLHYIWQTVRVTDYDYGLNDNIIRIRLSYTLN
ncbi:Protein of unknown function [Reichenbachiella agariperforans]|uniref:DUF2490 domain-containing protein n=1 Tax=Reichenbachiella agariperforans TaxID=156994 RepID=A0A1M6P055_REIAG|nr:DUF2490 domain-containing protein [Reichenbachiella agariperforans]SHK01301.1 Protein of unknown function [Reichenbachiella agariperforans]